MKFTFGYTGLRTRDLDAAARFYTLGLGMKEVSREKIAETGGLVAYLKSDGHDHPLELNWYPPGSRFDAPYEPGEALDHLFFKLEGGTLDEAIRHLAAHGGKLRIEPFREGNGRIAYVDSPDGHTIELFETDVAPR